MKRILPPILSIMLTGGILAYINQKNDIAFISKFAVVIIALGMFIGLWIGKFWDERTKN